MTNDPPAVPVTVWQSSTYSCRLFTKSNEFRERFDPPRAALRCAAVANRVSAAGWVGSGSEAAAAADQRTSWLWDELWKVAEQDEATSRSAQGHLTITLKVLTQKLHELRLPKAVASSSGGAGWSALALAELEQHIHRSLLDDVIWPRILPVSHPTIRTGRDKSRQLDLASYVRRCVCLACID